MKRGGRLKPGRPLERHTPLRQVSVKRLALETPAGGGGTITPTRGLARSTMQRSTGPDWNTVEAVLERDSWSCVRCGCGVHGERGIGWSIHHRRPRRNGGDTRPDVNLPSNLVTLCGSGTTGCHGRVESQRTEALDVGFLLHAEATPAKRQIRHAVHGWVFLLDNGRVRRIKD